MSTRFAVFDIDGTVIRWQLYHVIADKLANLGILGEAAKEKLRSSRMVWKRREHPESFKAYEHTLIEVYESALPNIKTEDFDKMVVSVIDEYKDQVYTYTRALIARLKKDNYTLLAISGSHHELVEQIAKYYGFDYWVGSHYERAGQGFSGEKFVASMDKKGVLEDLVSKHGLAYKESLAIGDSASDIPMLEMVDKPIAFNPDRALFKIASSKGWKIVIERKNMIYELEHKNGQYVLVQANT